MRFAASVRHCAFALPTFLVPAAVSLEVEYAAMKMLVTSCPAS